MTATPMAVKPHFPLHSTLLCRREYDVVLVLILCNMLWSISWWHFRMAVHQFIGNINFSTYWSSFIPSMAENCVVQQWIGVDMGGYLALGLGGTNFWTTFFLKIKAISFLHRFVVISSFWTCLAWNTMTVKQVNSPVNSPGNFPRRFSPGNFPPGDFPGSG